MNKQLPLIKQNPQPQTSLSLNSDKWDPVIPNAPVEPLKSPFEKSPPLKGNFNSDLNKPFLTETINTPLLPANSANTVTQFSYNNLSPKPADKNLLSASLDLMKPLLSNEPLDASSDHPNLNPLSLKGPQSVSLDRLNPNQKHLEGYINRLKSPTNLDPGLLSPQGSVNSNDQLIVAGSKIDKLKPILSLNQLNTPLAMKPLGSIPAQSVFDVVKLPKPIATADLLDAANPAPVRLQTSPDLNIHPQIAGNLNIPVLGGKPVIPGNPGPGIHTNIGGMVGVDGIGPNGLPVNPNINILLTTQQTALLPLTTPIPMTTLIMQRHVVMPEDNTCKCEPKSPSCKCRENASSPQETTITKPTEQTTRPINVTNACSYASQ